MVALDVSVDRYGVDALVVNIDFQQIGKPACGAIFRVQTCLHIEFANSTRVRFLARSSECTLVLESDGQRLG
jgi:hypothetical protein